MLSMRKTHSENDAPRHYGRSPAPTCHPREGGRTALSTLVLSAHGHQGGDLPASKGPGRAILASLAEPVVSALTGDYP